MTEETVAAPGPATQEDGSQGSAPSDPAGAEGGTAVRRPRRRRRRTPSKSGGQGRPTSSPETEATDEAPPDTPEMAAPDQGNGEETTSATGAPKRRRRRRGGRGRGRKPATAGTADAGTDEAETGPGGTQEEEAPKEPTAGTARKDGSTGGTATRRRTRRRSTGSSGEAKAAETENEEKSTEPTRAARASRTSTSRTTRTTRTSRSAKSTAKSAATTRTARTAKAEKTEEDQSRPTRTRRVRTPGRRRREPQPVIKRSRDKIMLITENGDRDQIAVLEGRDLIEHYITRAGAHSMVGNIYLGRVQNVLPGMEAAFVDVGRGRNAVLYAGEVAYDEEVEGQPRRIEQVLKPGQSVLVQVTKDPMGGKGARLTGEISVPGRFLVLVPNSQVFGLSRRLPDAERRRLRPLVKKAKPEEHGVIVRTAAEGATEEDLEADIKRLVTTWGDIEKRAKKAKPPKVLYEEPELTVRVVRDLFTDEEFKEIVTDSVPIFDSVSAYLRDVAPDLLENVRLHEGPLSLFEEHHLIEQIHKALERKVWLPSGGYIVIDRTEAMTVVDVNTGRHIGKTNLEETVVKTNLEAAEEIGRQLRLRDIGGIILIDFIDMLFEQNKDKVVRTLKDALAQDKTRSQVFDISPLGILEVTRKRVSAGLLESFSETCPTCEGRGILLTHDI